MTRKEKALNLIIQYTKKIESVKEAYLLGKWSKAQMDNDIRRYTTAIDHLVEQIKTENYFI